MARKKKLIALVSVCMAILTVAFCGCDDLGAYGDTEEYYGSFGDIVLISGALGKAEEYSVEDYFYNKESREKFLVGEDGVYSGVEHSDYIYMAIPFESDIDVDTVALYLQSQTDVTVYINVFLTNRVPANWRPRLDGVLPPAAVSAIADGNEQQGGTGGSESGNQGGTDSTGGSESGSQGGTDSTGGSEGGSQGGTGSTGGSEGGSQGGTDSTGGSEGGNQSGTGSTGGSEEEPSYDDPDPDTRIGEVAVNLKKGKWSSFTLDVFKVNGVDSKSIQIKEDQYILLQIRNNSGVRVYDGEKQIYVDPQTGLELQKAEITMTNLLIRALDVKKVQGGE